MGRRRWGARRVALRGGRVLDAVDTVNADEMGCHRLQRAVLAEAARKHVRPVQLGHPLGEPRAPTQVQPELAELGVGVHIGGVDPEKRRHLFGGGWPVRRRGSRARPARREPAPRSAPQRRHRRAPAAPTTPRAPRSSDARTSPSATTPPTVDPPTPHQGQQISRPQPQLVIPQTHIHRVHRHTQPRTPPTPATQRKRTRNPPPEPAPKSKSKPESEWESAPRSAPQRRHRRAPAAPTTPRAPRSSHARTSPSATTPPTVDPPTPHQGQQISRPQPQLVIPQTHIHRVHPAPSREPTNSRNTAETDTESTTGAGVGTGPGAGTGAPTCAAGSLASTSTRTGRPDALGDELPDLGDLPTGLVVELHDQADEFVVAADGVGWHPDVGSARRAARPRGTGRTSAGGRGRARHCPRAACPGRHRRRGARLRRGRGGRGTRRWRTGVRGPVPPRRSSHRDGGGPRRRVSSGPREEVPLPGTRCRSRPWWCVGSLPWRAAGAVP